MENCHHDHIPFNVKENGNTVFALPTSVPSLFLEVTVELRAREEAGLDNFLL